MASCRQSLYFYSQPVSAEVLRVWLPKLKLDLGGLASLKCPLSTVFQTSFGLTRMTIVVIPFLYVGTLISKNFAALLEEHDIFVPEDDDDDD